MNVTLTDHEAVCVLMLLKSITYEISGEDGLQFQATLFNLGERIETEHEDSETTQYALWESLGKPIWKNVRQPRTAQGDNND